MLFNLSPHCKRALYIILTLSYCILWMNYSILVTICIICTLHAFQSFLVLSSASLAGFSNLADVSTRHGKLCKFFNIVQVPTCAIFLKSWGVQRYQIRYSRACASSYGRLLKDFTPLWGGHMISSLGHFFSSLFVRSCPKMHFFTLFGGFLFTSLVFFFGHF